MMANIGSRLVHLDLKGAPPRIEYLEKLFPLLKRWGATGLLIEYEDMFPYEDTLQVLASPYAYSDEAVCRILELAEGNGLEVIPLVQTFGHFEFVLKHEKFVSLREVEQYPMTLCPSRPESLATVCEMIDQVMKLHPGITWFHIGCDEVYSLGHCDACKKRITVENIPVHQLFFDHVRDVASHIKTHYPAVTPIMWDDMLRFTELPVLMDSGLRGLVEPMVWHYLVSFQLPPGLWDRLSKVFPNIWVASAFKGATGACAYVTNMSYHLENNLAWLATLEREQSKFHSIRGIAVTGWQRYDHFAILCELLPEAVPSLAMCLQIVNQGAFTSEIHVSVSQQLKFVSLAPVNPFHSPDIPICDFPGSDIYTSMIEAGHLEAKFEQFFHSDSYVAWMNPFNVQRNFINPMHIQSILSESSKLLANFQQLEAKLQKALSQVYFDSVVIEWLAVFVSPKLEKITETVESARRLLSLPPNGHISSQGCG